MNTNIGIFSTRHGMVNHVSSPSHKEAWKAAETILRDNRQDFHPLEYLAVGGRPVAFVHEFYAREV